MDNKNIQGHKKLNGRIHLKNINNSCYTVKCNKIRIPNKNDSIVLSIPPTKYMRPSLKYCSNKTIEVLNKYFDFNSNLSLDVKLTNYKNEYHPCHPAILSDFKRIPSLSIGKTYKAKSKSYSKTLISKTKLYI
jgi:hypothetical protein